MRIEGFGHRGERARGDPRFDGGGNLLAQAPAVRLVVQVRAVLRLDPAEGEAEAGGLCDAPEIARCEQADHDVAPVGGAEIAPEGAEDMVADPRPVLAVDYGLADIAERRRRPERHRAAAGG